MLQNDNVGGRRKTTSTPAKRVKAHRSFVNSNYKKELSNLGYDADSQYVKTIVYYKQLANVTSRKSSSNSNNKWTIIGCAMGSFIIWPQGWSNVALLCHT